MGIRVGDIYVAPSNRGNGIVWMGARVGGMGVGGEFRGIPRQQEGEGGGSSMIVLCTSTHQTVNLKGMVLSISPSTPTYYSSSYFSSSCGGKNSNLSAPSRVYHFLFHRNEPQCL